MGTNNLLSCVSDYLDSILDVFSDGIYITDSNGKTLKVNKAYEKLADLKEEEISGKLVQDLIKDGVFDTALNPEIVATGKPKTCVQINERNRKIVLKGYPIFDKEGNVAFVVTLARDITVLSQLQEQITDQQKLIENYKQKFSYFQKGKTSSIIAQNQKMLEILETIKRVALTDVSILLLGETGVGKDVAARFIHKKSTRNNEPFFKVDCTSINENLIESELFGYAPGAFSGASPKGKPGYFELADKGTLFLDEIGELPLPMQAKLLRVLQDREIMSVGSTKVKKVDVRIIAATNRNLLEEVKKGNFRSDLYYRLLVAVIEIPPLRQRKEDILPLVSHFLEKYNLKYKRNMTLDNETLDTLLQYDWPGNIRELENLIQSLVVTKDKEIIKASDLPCNIYKNPDRSISNFPLSPTISEGKNLNEILAEMEKGILEQALNEYGSVSAAAMHLQVDRSTLFRKLKKYQS